MEMPAPIESTLTNSDRETGACAFGIRPDAPGRDGSLPAGRHNQLLRLAHSHRRLCGRPPVGLPGRRCDRLPGRGRPRHRRLGRGLLAGRMSKIETLLVVVAIDEPGGDALAVAGADLAGADRTHPRRRCGCMWSLAGHRFNHSVRLSEDHEQIAFPVFFRSSACARMPARRSVSASKERAPAPIYSPGQGCRLVKCARRETLET
jgi:hypothetical protein